MHALGLAGQVEGLPHRVAVTFLTVVLQANAYARDKTLLS